ncbi:hypothetical protein [Streptosporangium sp. NPDC000509]|uniref:hypothetical protein n=1 Tax=Streptosporangium sp. NPDC000509 TaxID=3366186 RepID=UPI00369FC87C
MAAMWMVVLLLGVTGRGWQLALLEALPVTLRDSARGRRRPEIRARTEADTRRLIVQGLSRLGRRPTVELELIVLLLLPGLVDRILTDTLLQKAPLETFSRRAGRDIATLLPHSSESEPESGSGA